ncbi:equilibrative nucleobase transporter 1-like [Argopecten irradians]|uniref:equilibrative nucleobase transporter 1-like n=1 Tax=Argopecten irradians TaxID=31199 RepID=UPI003711EC67
MKNTRRAALVLISLLEIFLFGGIQFGWFALVFILKQDGLFKDFCVSKSGGNATVTESSDCVLQDEQFTLIFSIGNAVFTVGTIVNGKLYQLLSIKRTRMLYISLEVAGILFFAFASSDYPWLLLPGIVLVGTSGVALLVSNFIQIPLLLQKGSSIYVGLLNGCYDSSVLTFMLVKKLYEGGVDKKFSFVGFSILVVVISGMCTLLHPSRDLSARAQHKMQSTNENVKVDDDAKGSQEVVVSPTRTDTTTNVKSTVGILRHPIFISHVLWMSIVILKYIHFLGSANRMMEQLLKDESQVSYFSDVMTFTMTGSLASSFIVGYTIHAMEKPFTGNMRMVVPLAVTSCLAILLSALAFVPVPSVLYVDFVLLTFLRSFMYTTNMEFIRVAFPLKYTSIVFGIVIAISGIISMTQYGLFDWTEKYDTATTHVNVFLLCLSVVSLVHPALVFYSAK